MIMLVHTAQFLMRMKMMGYILKWPSDVMRMRMMGNPYKEERKPWREL